MAQTQKFLVDLDLQGNQLKNVVLGTTSGTENGAIWFDAFTGLVKFVDGSGTVQSIAPKSYVDAEVAGEASSRASEITRVEGLISDEAAARALAISGLAADLSDEVINRGLAVSAVAADLADEVTARQNAVSNVASDLADEVSARQTAVSNVASDLADEATARANADITLQNNIDAVAADLAALDTNFATDAEVSSAVSAEQTRAEGVEAQLQSDLLDTNANIEQLGYDIAAEITARQNAITGVQNNIDDEVLARQNAVTAVQENLDDEVIAREAAVSAVANDLADEVSARQTAVQGVSNTLADEISRVETGINEVADFLDAEILNRQSADTTLQGNIDDEAAARQSGDFALDARVTDIEDAIPTFALQSALVSEITAEAARADAYADAAAATAEANAIAHADLIAQGLNVKEAVRTIVMQGPGLSQALTGTYTAFSKVSVNQETFAFEWDPNDVGVELAVGDHVIVTDYEGSTPGGIYTVQTGAWTLREDWENDTTKTGSFVYVIEGWFAGTSWASYEITTGPEAPYQNFTQMTGIPSLYPADASIALEADGYGISVNMDYLIQIQGVARKATGLITIGSGTTHTISHSLGQDVVVSVRKSATQEVVQAHVVCNPSAVVITLNESPADSALLVTIVG